MEDRPLPPGITPELLNDLYRVRRKAVGGDERRDVAAALEARGLSEHAAWIEDSFAIALNAPYNFLFDYPGGAVASDQLWAQHDAFVRTASPWLDDDNFAWVCHQSRYYAWHDGLVKG
jgi:hypothetical protein